MYLMHNIRPAHGNVPLQLLCQSLVLVTVQQLVLLPDLQHQLRKQILQKMSVDN